MRKWSELAGMPRVFSPSSLNRTWVIEDLGRQGLLNQQEDARCRSAQRKAPQGGSHFREDAGRAIYMSEKQNLVSSKDTFASINFT